MNLRPYQRFKKVPKDGSTLPVYVRKLEICLPRNPEHRDKMLELYGFKKALAHQVIIGSSYSDIRHSMIEQIIASGPSDPPLLLKIHNDLTPRK